MQCSTMAVSVPPAQLSSDQLSSAQLPVTACMLGQYDCPIKTKHTFLHAHSCSTQTHAHIIITLRSGYRLMVSARRNSAARMDVRTSSSRCAHILLKI